MTTRRTSRFVRDNPETTRWLLGLLTYVGTIVILAMLGVVHL